MNKLAKVAPAETADKTEKMWFDPNRIRWECARDLPVGLRMIADAIEAGEFEGRFLNSQGVGDSGNDGRMHILVKFLVISAACRQLKAEGVQR